MNTLALLHALLSPVLGQAGSFAVATLTLLQPTLSLLVPSVIAVLAHRYIANKAVADAVATGGGIAYSHMSSMFASGGFASGKLDYHQVKQQAVAAGVAALTEMAQRGLSKLSSGQMTELVDGALGKLLAADPAFSVTGPAPAVPDVSLAVSTVVEPAREAVLSAAEAWAKIEAKLPAAAAGAMDALEKAAVLASPAPAGAAS